MATNFFTKLALLLVTLCDIGVESFCEEGWLSTTNGRCVLLVNQPKTWSGARAYCIGKMARLHNPETAQRLNENIEVSTALGDRLIIETDLWWSGMYVDINRGRLMWDDIGPNFVVKRSFQRNPPWEWEQDLPAARSGSCGKLRLGIQEISTTLPPLTTPTESSNAARVVSQQYSGVTYMKLTQCDISLPFVCEKEDIRQDISKVSTCDEGWVGNVKMSKCFRIPRENISYQGAIRRCASYGGSLVPLQTRFSLLRSIVNYFTTNDTYFIATGIETLWMFTENNGRGDDGGCTVYINGDGMSMPCERRTNFMCEKDARPSNPPPVNITLDTVFLDQEVLWSSPANLGYPITAQFSRDPTDTESVFIETPIDVINPLRPGSSLRFRTSTSNIASTFNVTLWMQREEIPQRKRRSAQESLMEHIKALLLDRKKRQEPGGSLALLGDSDMIDYVGIYQFSYNNLNPPVQTSSTPTLIRFSERYLLIYVTYLTAPFKEFDISQNDIESANLLNDEQYVNMVYEFLGSVLYNRPEGATDVQTFKYKIEHIDAIKSEMKARLFITFGRDNITNNEEQEILMIWKDYLRTSSERLQSSQVFSTVACSTLKITLSQVTFAYARLGETRFSWERCYGGTGARASTQCIGSYEDGVRWGNFVYNPDCSKPPPSNETSESTTDLQRLSDTPVDEQNYVGIINETIYLTWPDLNLTRDDVIYTADVLYNQWEAQTDVTPVINDIFAITNNILGTRDGIIDEAHRVDNAANRIIRSVEDLTARVKPSNMRNMRIVQSFVAAEVWEQTGSDADYTIGLSLTNRQSNEMLEIQSNDLKTIGNAGDVNANATDAAIYLRKALVTNRKTKLSFQIYSKTSLFSTLRDRYKINSKVAAAKLFIEDVEQFQLKDGDVTAIFTPTENADDMVCGYWDYSADQDAGGWDTSGCITSRDGEQVICKCNHLTNFAVLIDLDAHSISDLDKDILGIITMVGLIISIVCLGITILTFLLFKHLRKGRGQQVLINLSVAIICSAIIFLVGIDRTENKVGCKAVAALLHYFILVSFMWMLVEGILQYLRFVKVLGTYIPKFMLKSMIPAWGLPLIPVIICLAVDHELHYTGEKGYCWLQYEAMVYAFLIPVGVIILANIIVFMIVMCKLVGRKNKNMVSNQSDRKMAFLHLQAGVSIFFILGLTWVFGFFAMTGAQMVFHYLFAIFNAFQGLFIFLLFTLKEKKIRDAWRKKCCGRKAMYKETSGTHSQEKKGHSNTNSTGLTNSESGHHHGNSKSSEDSGLKVRNPNYK